jgi:predicted Fe-Mo cluster-binding NifX family protein
VSKTLIAIPSDAPGGLSSPVGAHFGHCALFTLVEVEDGAVAAVSTLANPPHQQGGCMAPVNHLAGNGVNVLIAGGMGLRPLMGFTQSGISVYHGGQALTAGDAVERFLKGELDRFDPNATCGGH